MQPRSLIRGLRRLSFLALSLGTIGSAQVLINEVLYRFDSANSDPLRSKQWVELFNKGADPVSLAGWIVSGRDGSKGRSARPLPSVSIPAGGYLVVHFTSGTNRLTFSDGTGDVYTGDSTPVLNPDSDEAALYSTTDIVDFIAWADNAVPYAPGSAHKDAVAAAIWTPGVALNSDGVTVLPFEIPRLLDLGASIGRDPNSTDTNTTADFEPHGGVGALDISPSRQNLDRIKVISVGPSAAGQANSQKPRTGTAPKKWTVLFYVNGDNSLEVPWYAKVRAAELAGGSDENVNFVLMYDGKLMTNGTLRGLMREAGDFGTLTLEHPPGESVELNERDMGDPAELKGFIDWAKKNYPAEHYALFLSAHGDGWKGFGPDETSPGTSNEGDYLYMGELRTALAGQHFDLLVWDACMMAGIEVADQVRGFADYMVASEQLGYGVPYYDLIASALKMNPNWSGLDLGKNVVASYVNYVSRKYASPIPSWTISLIDENRLTDLIQQVDAWSLLMKNGAGLFQFRDYVFDNVHVRMRLDRMASQSFGDRNFVDLYDLAQHIQKDSGMPACVKVPIANILALIDGQVVVTEQHSGLAIAKGLHIYFPQYRKRDEDNPFVYAYDDYDLPATRLTDGGSLRAVYAVNNDKLPKQARDRETVAALNPRTEWPEPPSPQLVFVSDTHWSQFLERYYHPVADNHIVRGKYMADDFPAEPTGGGDCANPIDIITVPVGATVFFSGGGSSDADTDLSPVATAPPIPSFFPTYYFWDLDASIGCQSKCKSPVEVGTGSDAALAANDNMDMDRDDQNTTWDDKDASGQSVTRDCEGVGQFVVTLIVWDDDHLKTRPFHDTGFGAPYVHPQTDSQQAIVNCTALPFEILLDDPPPGITVQQNEILIGIVKAAGGLSGSVAQPASAARAPRAATASGSAIPNYPLLVSTTPGTPAVTASGTNIPPGGSSVVKTDISGVFSLVFTPTATGPGQITVKALGGPSQTISFTVGPALAVTNVSANGPPGGQIAVGQSGTVKVQATNHGEPVSNAPVNFQAVFGNVALTGGTPFAHGSGAQVKTDVTGTAQINLQGVTPGTEQILVTAGPIAGALNLTVTGTPPSAPTGVGMLTLPALADVGQPTRVVALAVAGQNPFPGAQIAFQVAKGNISFVGSPAATQLNVSTDANGQATARFTPNDATPILLNVSIAGTQLATSAAIPVRLPTDVPTRQSSSISIGAVTNAASAATSSIAPGEIVTIYGKGLGPSTLTYSAFSDNTLPAFLAEVQILFNGLPAPFIYLRNDQSAAIVPFGVGASGETTAVIQAEVNGSVSAPVNMPITNTQPGIFSADQSGKGQGAIQNADGSANSTNNPAATGSVIVLYLSGLGRIDPALPDGSLSPTSGVPALHYPVTVTIAGQQAQVVYQGPAPGAVAGLYQVNCIVPTGLSTGSVPVTIISDGRTSQPNLTLAVK